MTDSDTNGKAWLVLRRIKKTWGGPEEGGWWIRDSFVEASRRFDTVEEARAAKSEWEATAEHSTVIARDRFSWFCRETLDAAEARGLEASDLAEVDGPDRFVVTVEDEEPQDFINPNRHYC